ncbi:hypothetical protein V8B97DRAFT_1917426 [Scleroderma yunnanense]
MTEDSQSFSHRLNKYNQCAPPILVFLQNGLKWTKFAKAMEPDEDITLLASREQKTHQLFCRVFNMSGDDSAQTLLTDLLVLLKMPLPYIIFVLRLYNHYVH